MSAIHRFASDDTPQLQAYDDAYVQLGKSQPVDPNKYGPGHAVLTGIASSPWYGSNNATSYVSTTNWTLNLHCTSDMNSGIITSG